jgi:hypothetical protein
VQFPREPGSPERLPGNLGFAVKRQNGQGIARPEVNLGALRLFRSGFRSFRWRYPRLVLAPHQGRQHYQQKNEECRRPSAREFHGADTNGDEVIFRMSFPVKTTGYPSLAAQNSVIFERFSMAANGLIINI